MVLQNLNASLILVFEINIFDTHDPLSRRKLSLVSSVSFSYFFSTDSRAVVFALILLSDTHRSIYAVRITTVCLCFDVDDIVVFAVALFDIIHRVLLDALLRFRLQIRHKISSFPHMKE